MIRVTTAALIAALAANLSGCASIVTGQAQIISVTTPICPGASCTLKNEEGTYYVQTTPGNATVNREYGDLHVTCSKEGYEPFSMNVASSTKAMAFGNILFGGIIGAAVDVGTGAAYDYPQQIVVPLECRSAEAIAAAPTSGEHDDAAAKLVDLSFCEFPVFVFKDKSGEIYKSRCQEDMVGVIRCREGTCELLNVASSSVVATSSPTPSVSSMSSAPQTQQIPADGTTLKVAIFYSLCAFGCDAASEQMVIGSAEGYIRRHEHLELKYSYYSDRVDMVEPGTKLWSGSNEHQPLKDNVYRTGAQINADVVLMYYLMTWNFFEFEVFLFDIKNKREYRSKSNKRNYKQETERLFEEVLRNNNL